MKRECGEGELIPISYTVMSCAGKTDDEKEQKFRTLDFALSAYRAQVSLLASVEYSDVRLYANDKKGYSNCILYWSQRSGEVKNRLNEL